MDDLGNNGDVEVSLPARPHSPPCLAENVRREGYRELILCMRIALLFVIISGCLHVYKCMLQ